MNMMQGNVAMQETTEKSTEVGREMDRLNRVIETLGFVVNGLQDRLASVLRVTDISGDKSLPEPEPQIVSLAGMIRDAHKAISRQIGVLNFLIERCEL